MCFHSFDNFKTQCHLVAIIAKKCKLHDTPQLNSTLKLVNRIVAVIAILLAICADMKTSNLVPVNLTVGP